MHTVRASSWPTLFDCSLRWYYEHVVGLRLPMSTAARLGTAVHAGAARYDAGGASDDACNTARHAFTHPEEDAEPISRGELADGAHTASMLVRAYGGAFGRVRYSHVEVKVSSCILTTPHGAIEVTGTVDRIRDGKVRDIKTGRGRVKSGAVDMRADYMQLGIYALMAQAEMPDYPISKDVDVIAGDTATGAWAEGTARNAVDLLLGTEEEPGLVEMAAKILTHGAFAPNPKSLLCSAKYCAAFAHKRCKYHGK